jgi:hypothetical protein
VWFTLFSFIGTAQGQDTPHVWTRGLAAVVLNPSGVAVDVVSEARAPVLRRGGAVFNMTFAGVGARVTATPAHAEFAARATVQLIDILPITVEGFYGNYWESPFGPVPMATVPGQRPSARRSLYTDDRDFPAYTLGFTVSPTFQIAAGPVVALSNVSFTWLSMKKVPSNPEPYVFDPYRGVVMEPNDRIIDHTSAVLWMPLDGKDRALLRVGPVARGRVVHHTTDEMLTVGGLVQWRPGTTDDAANLTLVVAPYAIDPDFQGWAPNVLLALTVARISPFKKGPPEASTTVP